MRIDSHQHFWKFHPLKDAWITDDMKVIQRDFLPNELLPSLNESGISGCVAMQADQSEGEAFFLLDLAKKNDFIKGAVGWVALSGEDLKSRLDYFSQCKKLKGFRHIVSGEPQDDFFSGITQLEKYNFTYDILTLPKHLPYALVFVKQFSKQQFVIDNIATPDFKQTYFSEWEKGIREIASCPNVFCKISGLVTEANWNNGIRDDFTYCLNVVDEGFNIDSLMFGSDWPVCLLAATYKESNTIFEKFFLYFRKNNKINFADKMQ